MNRKDLASILIFKILLPTIDVVTDWLLAVQLITGFNYDPDCSQYFKEYHVYMGIAVLAPAVIVTLFHLHHWYHLEKKENGGDGRLKTFPLVVLQFYPQYRYMKLIYNFVVKKKAKRCEKELEFLNREISGVEPLVESYPQFLILNCLTLLVPKCFGISSQINCKNTEVYFKLILAFTSCNLGIINFLTHGPVAIYTNQFRDLGFYLANVWIWSILFLTSVVVGNLYVYLMSLNGGIQFGYSKMVTFGLVFGLVYLPRFLFTFIALVVGIGFKPSLKLIWRCPAIISIATFHFFVVAPVNYDSKYFFHGCYFSGKGKTVQVNHELSNTNYLFVLFYLLVIVIFLPINSDKIITISSDGTNVAFGLEFTAYQMKITAIISLVLAILILPLVLINKHFYPRYKDIVQSEVINLENLDNYKCDFMHEDLDDEIYQF